MNKRMRKQWERALRVAEFSRQYPSDLPGYLPTLGRLEETTARTDAVAQRELTGRLASREAVAERLRLRETITADLQLLAAIARSAGKDSAGIPVVITYPGPQRNQRHFLNGARVAVATAAGRQDRLAGLGLTAELLAGLTADLDEFERLLARREEAIQIHVAARRELDVLAGDMSRMVKHLHALNRHRFRTDPAALAAWRRSRLLGMPAGSTAEPNATGQVTGGSQTPIALPPGQPVQ